MNNQQEPVGEVAWLRLADDGSLVDLTHSPAVANTWKELGKVVQPLIRLSEHQRVIAEWDKILRSSVPERWKNCTSPVGAVQSYIAELEQRLKQLGVDIDG